MYLILKKNTFRIIQPKIKSAFKTKFQNPKTSQNSHSIRNEYKRQQYMRVIKIFWSFHHPMKWTWKQWGAKK